MNNPTQGGTVLNLSDRELDERIYRIMPEEYVFRIFKDDVNILSQVHNWKDKFENFQLKLGGVLNGEPFEYGFRDDFVGQCWTRESLSEAMWGIYANDTNKRYLRIRSTPRRLLNALAESHPNETQDKCFIGKVMYKRESELKAYVDNGRKFELRAARFAESLLLKRRSFRHEKEVRLILFGDSSDFCEKGLYRYKVNPHEMITQIMADPNRERKKWKSDQERIRKETDFDGEIKRSKIYDAPDWDAPVFSD